MQVVLTLIIITTALIHSSHQIMISINHLSNQTSDTDLLLTLTDSRIYNRYLIPHFDTDTPIPVTVDLYIKEFSSFSAADMQYTVNLIFRQRWRDERLDFEHLADQRFRNIADLDIHPDFLDRIWQPDPAFTNYKGGTIQSLLSPSKLLRIYKNGTVLYSAMMSLILSCQMDLEHYPLDIQRCPIEFESFGYQVKNIDFQWKLPAPIQFKDIPENVIISDQDDPSRDQRKSAADAVMESAQFTLLKYELNHNCKRSYNTGQFSCLGVVFIFKRNVGYHIIQTFLPSSMIVILSFVSFWFSADATPARTVIGVTSVLTMTTQSSGARKDLPAVSYIKAIDIWMTTCLTYVFAALIEFAIVNYYHQQYLKESVNNEPGLSRLGSSRKRKGSENVSDDERLYSAVAGVSRDKSAPSPMSVSGSCDSRMSGASVGIVVTAGGDGEGDLAMVERQPRDDIRPSTTVNSSLSPPIKYSHTMPEVHNLPMMDDGTRSCASGSLRERRRRKRKTRHNNKPRLELLRQLSIGGRGEPQQVIPRDKLADSIDNWSKVLFPATFITFNIVFLLVYSFKEQSGDSLL